MAAITANRRVFFVVLFTVGCIGVKTVSGYPSSSYNEDERYATHHIDIHQISYFI